MTVTPFSSDTVYLNDPEDFNLPYRFSGKTDTEVMFRKYQNLRKSTHGYIVRLGIVSIR